MTDFKLRATQDSKELSALVKPQSGAALLERKEIITAEELLASLGISERALSEAILDGVLSIQLPRYLNEVKSSWGDGKRPLEENLAAVFEGFLIAAVRYKERSDELAAWRAEIKERERIRAEKEAELAQVQSEREMLMKEAQRWAECNHLRAYISYIETELKSGGKQISDAALKWVADSRTHAELLDPTGSRLRALIERA